MTPVQLALRRVEVRLLERLEQLERRLGDGDSTAWVEYAQLTTALAAIAPQTTPGASGRLLTTAELAAALGCSSKTVLRKRQSGDLTAMQLGKRGRAALRWAAPRAGA